MHKVYKNKMVRPGQTVKKAKSNKSGPPEPALERSEGADGGK